MQMKEIKEHLNKGDRHWNTHHSKYVNILQIIYIYTHTHTHTYLTKVLSKSQKDFFWRYSENSPQIYIEKQRNCNSTTILSKLIM